MIVFEQAVKLAELELRNLEVNATDKLALLDKETMLFEYGWIFFYQSDQYVNTGNEYFLVGGNAPIIVDKFTSLVVSTGTRRELEFYIEKYIMHRNDIEEYYRSIL